MGSGILVKVAPEVTMARKNPLMPGLEQVTLEGNGLVEMDLNLVYVSTNLSNLSLLVRLEPKNLQNSSIKIPTFETHPYQWLERGFHCLDSNPVVQSMLQISSCGIKAGLALEDPGDP